MVDIQFTLDLLDPDTEPVANGAVGIAPAVATVTGAGKIVAAEKLYALSDPFNVIDLPPSTLYHFREYKPKGDSFFAYTPAADGNYSALVPLVVVPLGPTVTYSADQVDTKLAAKAARQLPAYVPSSVASTYDTKATTYNWKASNTRRLRAGLGKAAAGGLCEVVAIGDSSVAGCTNGATLAFDRLRAWPISARDELGRHGMPVAGSGLVRALEGPTIVDSRWTFPSGTWDSSQYTFPFLLGAGVALYTSERAGDRVFVKYYDPADGGSFTISVNGASSGAGFQTVTYSSAGQKSVTLAVPIAAGQTVRLTRVGGSLWPVGVNVFSSTGGVMVHNIAQSGSKAFGTGNTSWVNIADSPNIMNVFASVTTDGSAPAAVFIGLGGNDKTAGNTNAQITTALTTIRNRYPNSDCILVAPNQLNDTYVTAAAWEAYIATLYQLADTIDVPLIDMRARVGNYATTVANGISVDGQGHLTAPAYADLGRQVGMLLAS